MGRFFTISRDMAATDSGPRQKPAAPAQGPAALSAAHAAPRAPPSCLRVTWARGRSAQAPEAGPGCWRGALSNALSNGPLATGRARLERRTPGAGGQEGASVEHQAGRDRQCRGVAGKGPAAPPPGFSGTCGCSPPPRPGRSARRGRRRELGARRCPLPAAPSRARQRPPEQKRPRELSRSWV